MTVHQEDEFSELLSRIPQIMLSSLLSLSLCVKKDSLGRYQETENTKRKKTETQLFLLVFQFM